MKILKPILIFFLVVFVIIGGFVAFTFDGSAADELPLTLYSEGKASSEMIFEELNNSFEDVEDGTTPDLNVNINEDVFNMFIYEKIIEQFPDYNPGTDCATNEECYVVSAGEEDDNGAHIVGAYMTLESEDDESGRLILNIPVESKVLFFTYKTVLQAHFIFSDDTTENEYVLEFDKIQMGNLRIPKGVFKTILTTAESNGIFSLDNESLPIGEFDSSSLTYTIKKNEVLTKLADSSEESSYNQLSQELLSISFDRDYILLDVTEENFDLTVKVSQFRNTDEAKREIPLYLYDLHDQRIEGTELVYGEYNPELFDPTSYLQDVFTQFLFTSTLNNDENFEIDEEIFNKLIYSNAEGFTQARKVESITLSDGETKDIELGLKSIWFEFEDNGDNDVVYAHALFRIAGIDSLLVIKADVEYVEVTENGSTVTEMHCVFNEITFGKDDAETEGQYIQVSDLDAFKEVFKSIDDVQFGEFNDNGDLIINPTRLTELLTGGTVEGAIEVTKVFVVEGALALEITANSYQGILDAFQTDLNSVLGSDVMVSNLTSALNPTPGSVEEDVINAVSTVQSNLEAGEEVTQEQIDDMMDGFEDLDPDSQADFLQTFNDLLDDDTLTSFESIFGTFVDTEEE